MLARTSPPPVARRSPPSARAYQHAEQVVRGAQALHAPMSSVLRTVPLEAPLGNIGGRLCRSGLEVSIRDLECAMRAHRIGRNTTSLRRIRSLYEDVDGGFSIAIASRLASVFAYSKGRVSSRVGNYGLGHGLLKTPPNEYRLIYWSCAQRMRTDR